MGMRATSRSDEPGGVYTLLQRARPEGSAFELTPACHAQHREIFQEQFSVKGHGGGPGISTQWSHAHGPVRARATFKRAVTHHEFPNSDPGWRGDPIREPVMRDLSRAVQECGIKARKGRILVGPYELGEILDEGSASQDRLATHRTMRTIQRRARTYLVPQQTSVERRQALRRAADLSVRAVDVARRDGRRAYRATGEGECGAARGA
jgi:hypothetical protein